MTGNATGATRICESWICPMELDLARLHASVCEHVRGRDRLAMRGDSGGSGPRALAIAVDCCDTDHPHHSLVEPSDSARKGIGGVTRVVRYPWRIVRRVLNHVAPDVAAVARRLNPGDRDLAIL